MDTTHPRPWTNLIGSPGCGGQFRDGFSIAAASHTCMLAGELQQRVDVSSPHGGFSLFKSLKHEQTRHARKVIGPETLSGSRAPLAHECGQAKMTKTCVFLSTGRVMKHRKSHIFLPDSPSPRPSLGWNGPVTAPSRGRATRGIVGYHSPPIYRQAVTPDGWSSGFIRLSPSPVESLCI